jgi:hypothetical protein
MRELTSPIWWISVVVVGLAVNLASAYLKPRLDALLLRSSSRWRSRSAERLARRRQAVDELRSNEKHLAFAYLRVISARLEGVQHFAFSAWVAAMSTLAMLLRRPLSLPEKTLIITGLLGVMLIISGGLAALVKVTNEIALIHEAEAGDAGDAIVSVSAPPS